MLRMLIIIMIDHGQDNQRGLQNPVEDEKGQTSTGRQHFTIGSPSADLASTKVISRLGLRGHLGFKLFPIKTMMRQN